LQADHGDIHLGGPAGVLKVSQASSAGRHGGTGRGGLPGRLDGPLLPEHPQKPVIDAAEDTSHGEGSE
jgi:hypothetical protein